MFSVLTVNTVFTFAPAYQYTSCLSKNFTAGVLPTESKFMIKSLPSMTTVWCVSPLRMILLQVEGGSLGSPPAKVDGL